MPLDDSSELFDVVDEATGEPLLVAEETAAAEAGEAEGGAARGDGDANGHAAKTSTSTSTEKSTKEGKKRRTVPRGVAHATGTWHASVYVHLSRKRDGAFLIQRRSAKKDVCPLLWDLACAEHVRAGESSLAAAAARGLAEELGVQLEGSLERLGAPLGPPRQAVLRIEGPPLVWDREVVTSFWLRDFEVGFDDDDDDDDDSVEGVEGEGVEREESKGAIKFDEAEVSEVRWVSPSELRREVEEAPERFTPWFLAELRARPELLLQEKK